MIPLALALDAISRRDSSGSSRMTVAAAVTFLTLVVVFLLLGFAKVIADVVYMDPARRGWGVAYRRLLADF